LEAPSHIPQPEDEYRVVIKGSPEYQAFIKRIEVNNLPETKQKISVCLLCWGFITYHQKRRHQEHAHYTVTPVYFKSEVTFLSLAKKHGKLQDNGMETLIAIFAD
jgi:hypothetical protein